MRICVQGHCDAARVLKGYLQKSGFFIVPMKNGIPLFPDYTIFLDQNDELSTVQVDSIDCSLERKVLNLIEELGVQTFILNRGTGIRDDRAIHVTYPSKYQREVELGIFRALQQECSVGWARKLKRLLWLILLIPSLSQASELPKGFIKQAPLLFYQSPGFPVVRFWDGSTLQIVNAGDFANNAVRVTAGGVFHITCDAGCGSTTFADAAAFTFGTTSISNIGFVVDDVATNTVAENSAGAPRMNTNRIAYFNPRNNAGTEIGTAANPFRVDPTGSTTQPISGTITANQGTAAASTAGWPGIQGTVAATTAAWTSATAVDTTISASITGYACVLIDARVTGTISSGAIIFEASRDGANWSPLEVLINAVVTPGEQLTGMNFGLNVGSAYFERGVSGFTNVRIRLNPVITNTGTANVAILPLASDCGGWPTSLDNNGKTKIAIYNINQTPANADNGASGLGTLRVTLANNSTGNIATIGTSITPGTAAANLGKAEDVGHVTGDTGVFALGVRVDPTTTATTSANTDYSAIAVDHVGAVAIGVHPGRFSCFIENVTVTTQCQAAPAAGLRAYVTSFTASNEAATVQTLDIVFGTGAACVTGTTALTHKHQFGTVATTTSPFVVSATYGDNTPLVPTAANAICVRPSAATAFGATITGFIAP